LPFGNAGSTPLPFREGLGEGLAGGNRTPCQSAATLASSTSRQIAAGRVGARWGLVTDARRPAAPAPGPSGREGGGSGGRYFRQRRIGSPPFQGGAGGGLCGGATERPANRRRLWLHREPPNRRVGW